MRIQLVVVVVFCAFGCTPKPVPDQNLNDQLNSAPLDPNKIGPVLETVGSNWWFGQGVGETALMVGTVVIFPPYLIAVLGNEALDLSGYEKITVSGTLPGEAGEQWSEAYNSVTSLPGKLNSAIADREYVTPEVAKSELTEAIKAAQLDPPTTHSGNPTNSSLDSHTQEYNQNEYQR